MAKKNPSLIALEEAVAKAGSPAKLAQAIGFTRQAVDQILKGDRRIPAEWCPKIEAATGIPRARLRPDLYT